MTILTKEQILCAGLAPGFARLRRVALRLSEGRALDAADVVFLADAFERIIDGIPANEALDAVRLRGRHPETGAEADIWFARVIEVERLRRDAGMSLVKARVSVANRSNVSEETLRTRHQAGRKQALRMLEILARELELERRVTQLMEREAEIERSAMRFFARHAATKGGF